MIRSFKAMSLWAVAALACFSCFAAHAALIANGGFEAGFTGWSRVDQVGSDGAFFTQTGTASPVNGDPVPPPPEGLTAAMTDAGGPGSHVLFQDFLVPASVGTTFLSFDLFIGNRADAFRTPNHLDFATPALNQQARVDLLHGLTDPFSLSTTDVVLNLFQTNVGDPLVSGYTHFSIDVTSVLNANANTVLRLRFAEVDNVGPFQFGVDNVNIASPAAPPGQAPEPASYILMIAGLISIAIARRRRVTCAQRLPR